MNKKTELDILKDIRSKYGQLFQKDTDGDSTFEVTVEIASYISKALSQKEEEVRREVLEIAKQCIGNNYHNLGMGELDYHEKCAVDAFIETFKHKLTKTK